MSLLDGKDMENGGYLASAVKIANNLLNNYHGFKSDHLIQGGHRLYTYLSILFNAMIRHVYNPIELLLSSIISIPKDIKSFLHDSNNYRGISLFNAICKVYDHAIIFLCYNKFITSDVQFGFKANHSTYNV